MPTTPRPPITKCMWQVTATDTTGTVRSTRIWGNTRRQPNAATQLRFWRSGYGWEFPAGVVVTVERVAA